MVLRRILVINPNSSLSATKNIEASIAPLRLEGGPEIQVTRLEDGPPAIVTREDVESVIAPLAALVAREDASAFVLACFSDPGLSVVRKGCGVASARSAYWAGWARPRRSTS
jgi:Asp/Glu/hydantoin racemase